MIKPIMMVSSLGNSVSLNVFCLIMCFEICDRYGYWNNNSFCKYAFTVKPVLMGHSWVKADSNNVLPH